MRIDPTRPGRRVARAGLVAITLAGCGPSETSRLAADSAAVLTDEEGQEILVTVPILRPDGRRELGLQEVASGTRVTILEDRPGLPSTRPALRLVRVRVEEGPHKGLVGEVNRVELQPAR